MAIKPRMQGWSEVDPMAWDIVRNKESLCILFFIQHSVSHVFLREALCRLGRDARHPTVRAPKIPNGSWKTIPR
jgi:hypothetical protein